MNLPGYWLNSNIKNEINCYLCMKSIKKNNPILLKKDLKINGLKKSK